MDDCEMGVVTDTNIMFDQSFPSKSEQEYEDIVQSTFTRMDMVDVDKFIYNNVENDEDKRDDNNNNNSNEKDDEWHRWEMAEYNAEVKKQKDDENRKIELLDKARQDYDLKMKRMFYTTDITHNIDKNHASASNEVRRAFAAETILTSQMPPPLGAATIVGIKPASPLYLDNTVLTTNFGVQLSMRLLSSAFRGEYNPDKFAAVVFRLKNPRCAGLAFNSGKFVVTGVKKEEDGLLAIHIFHNIIEQILGIKLHLWDVKIENVVCDCSLGYPIDLPKLKQAFPILVNYEPGEFPGAHMLLPGLDTMVKVFASGSVIGTGAQDIRLMPLTFQAMYRILKRFRKDYLPTHRETVYALSQAYKTNTTNIFEDSRKTVITVDEDEKTKQQDLAILADIIQNNSSESTINSPFALPAGFIIDRSAGADIVRQQQTNNSTSILQTDVYANHTNVDSPLLVLPPPPPPLLSSSVSVVSINSKNKITVKQKKVRSVFKEHQNQIESYKRQKRQRKWEQKERNLDLLSPELNPLLNDNDNDVVHS